MRYYNVINDIIKDYINYIDKNELELLIKIKKTIENINENEISDDIILFINKILDRIWNLTLTDIKNFKSGEDFCFLVKTISYGYDFKVNNVFDHSYNYKLISSNNLINQPMSEVGEIVIPNYSTNMRTIPLLPNYFEKGRNVYKFNTKKICNYSLSGIFNFLNLTYDMLNYLDSNAKVLILDKVLYNKLKGKEDFSEADLDYIITRYFKMYVYEFLHNEYIIPEEYKTLRGLRRKKGSISKIIKKYYDNEITKEEFRDLMFDIVKKELNSVIEKNNSLTNKK